MDPIQQIVDNIPDWVKRLDELSAQIDRRQLELAKFDVKDKESSSARSIRNRGSTESLKPKDDGVAHPNFERDVTPPSDAPSNQQRSDTDRISSPGEQTPSAIQRQRNEVIAAAQHRVRAVIRKKQKTDSVISAEGALPKYRSRSMVIVYYDSYVQSFFEELVKYVSSVRNSMRKAKMNAKVAQIKMMAEMEMPDEEDDDDDDDELRPGDALIAADPKPRLPTSRNSKDSMEEFKLRYAAGRLPSSPAAGRMYAIGGIPGFGPGSPGLARTDTDIFDTLDKMLEFVQGMCERGAHQFLRDGECTEEIAKMKERLQQTMSAAEEEAKKNPAGASGQPDPSKVRSYRPMSMRKVNGASSSLPTPKKRDLLEVDDDEGVQDMGGLRS